MPDRLHVLVDGRAFALERRGNTVVFDDGRVVTVTRTEPGRYRIDDETGTHEGLAAAAGDRIWTAVGDETFECRISTAAAAEGPAAGSGILASPMPATVTAVPVQVGQVVEPGDVLVALEAMKMELPIRAPHRGLIKALHCRVGELVQPDVILVELAPA